jgi:LCP family protein required for cell wall assembly
MAQEEKPYRVYRGGRVKGKVPAPARRGRPQRAKPAKDGGQIEYRGPGARERRVSWGRRIALGALVLFVLIVIWGALSYLSFSSGVSDAHKRLDSNARLALTSQGGLLISHPTTVLLLGTDTAQVGGREGDRHSDSITLVRTDPSHHRLSYLSVPRDLRVPVPGLGDTKINAAMQAGGAALAIKTIREFTGIQINHVVIVDFADFKSLIDALGGITVNVPRAILSNPFDCPYTQQRCLRWKGWRFHKGPQTMSGQRALVYSRIRENQLDPSETDITRGARQQAVLQAVAGKLTSFTTLLTMPFDGASFVKPLTTDLSAGQLLQLGWLKFRSSNSTSLHCRLGGDVSTSTGQSVIEPSEDNRNVIAMFEGDSAPQPPPPGQPFAPGCVTGHVLQ